MVFVTVWDVMESIGSKIEFSASERASTLRLDEEVLQVGDPGLPGPFRATMGEQRLDLITYLGRSFGRAHQISSAAALLENVLHHAEAQPKLFDMRQTGLPRLSTSAVDELRVVLFGAAQFEERLIKALGAGKFRNFPRHGGAQRIGFSQDDWKSHPRDHDIVHKLTFVAEEIQPLLREAGIPFGPMHDAFTGNVIERSEVGPVEGAVSTSRSGIGSTSDPTSVEVPALELLPIERVENPSSGNVTEQLRLETARGGTPRRFTDEELAYFEQRNKNGEKWKTIAAELGMRERTLERQMTAHRKRLEKAKEAAKVSVNPYDQLGNVPGKTA